MRSEGETQREKVREKEKGRERMCMLWASTKARQLSEFKTRQLFTSGSTFNSQITI